MSLRSLSAGLIGLLLLGAPAGARIHVVSLPERQSVQLTIYNSVDLTLVRETRLLTFRQGMNRLEFSWANTLIDPTSVEFKPLTHAAEVEVLDVSFPARVANTLEWRIASEFAGEVEVEIRYFTSGIAWAADYVVEAAPLEKSMSLAGAVKVTNNSGEDYENTQVRLVVGVIRLVEEIAQLARSGRPTKTPMTEILRDESSAKDLYSSLNGRMSGFGGGAFGGAAPARKKDIVKEGLSEYFLYTVEGRDTIPNGWAKRLPSFQTKEVPINSFYKFEKEVWADGVMRYYRFTNSTAARLGREPLPDGAVKAFRLLGNDGLYAFAGRTSVKYIPVDERVDLELGLDQEVLVKPTLMDWTKTNLESDAGGNVKGLTLKETWQFEVQNSKAIDIVLDIRRNFSGDWSLQTDAEYEKVDATKVKFVLPLKPGEKRVFRYELTQNFGTRIRK